jgi:hypothetical protein
MSDVKNTDTHSVKIYYNEVFMSETSVDMRNEEVKMLIQSGAINADEFDPTLLMFDFKFN